MPRNGSGNYSLPTNAWNPAINGVSATPADWQALINDVAAAIQASVSADGQTPVTGNLQMGGHLLTGAGAPSGTGMSLRWEQLTRGADIPSATSITIPLEGQFFAVTGTTAITGFDATIAGRLVYIKFDAGIVLTNSASFILPGGVNITTQADDIAVFLSVSIGVWECVSYPRVQNSAASSDHYGATAPVTTYPGMTWADSATNTLWRRNATNNAWVSEGSLFIAPVYPSAAQWLGTPIGVPFPLHESSPPPPSNDPNFRYIILQAGETAAGGYNVGALTGETVTGTLPILNAVATVSLAGSPLNGLQIHLINSERRFVAPGTTSAFEEDSDQRITGTISAVSSNGAATGVFNTTDNGPAYISGSAAGRYVTFTFDNSTAVRTSDHTQPRTWRMRYFMRIK